MHLLCKLSIGELTPAGGLIGPEKAAAAATTGGGETLHTRRRRKKGVGGAAVNEPDVESDKTAAVGTKSAKYKRWCSHVSSINIIKAKKEEKKTVLV